MSRPDRREQLLDVAEDLFVARGYSGVSMEDIAQAASVSRPVPYQHFSSKEGVYLACVERARAQLERRIVDSTTSVTTPREALRAGGRAFFQMLADEPGRWRLLFAGSSVLPGEHDEALADLRFHTIDAIENLLRHFATRADARAVTAAAHAVSGVGDRLGHWWLRSPDLSLDDLLEHYLANTWPALAPLMDEPEDQ